MNKLGIYVHFPFCRSKCGYCDFYSKSCTDGFFTDYTRSLIRSIVAFKPNAEGYTVDTVYFGGGTPSLMSMGEFSAIRRAIRPYGLDGLSEFTFEANPGTVSFEKLRHLRFWGVDRLSFGLQSGVDSELATLGRIHTASEAADAFGLARRAGFENISLDLIYGIPGQTKESLDRSIDLALSLSPEHISFYGLKIEPGTPFFGRYTEDDDLQAELYLHGAERLKAAGYEHYEVSNFARPGFRSKHNMRYWTLGEYIGFGPSAHSLFKGRRFYHPNDLESFSSEIEEGPFEPEKEYIMLGLRTSDGVNKELLTDAQKAVLKKYSPYVIDSGESISLNAEGWLISNRIISELI